MIVNEEPGVFQTKKKKKSVAYPEYNTFRHPSQWRPNQSQQQK